MSQQVEVSYKLAYLPFLEQLASLTLRVSEENKNLINLLAAKGPLEFQVLQSATLTVGEETPFDNEVIPLDSRKGEDDLYGAQEPSEDFDDSKWAVSDGTSVPYIY